MKVPDLNPAGYREAVLIQNRLRKKLILQTSFDKNNVNIIAGCDNSIIKEKNLMLAGVILFKFNEAKELVIIEKTFSKGKINFPYIPGLLSFREIPTLLSAFKKLKNKPDLIFADGQGYAHPRRMGLASHLGIILNTPTIGVAKSRYIGVFKEPGKRKGSVTDLVDKDEIIGKVFRNRANVKPVFISPGHLVGMNDIINLVKMVSGKFRIPVPTRIAHIETGKFRMELLNNVKKK
ncbi:endonuclease V [Candidatus Dependentiae bacterium]|nr:endonuclease V [Candidatus Dependentiae bacterium]